MKSERIARLQGVAQQYSLDALAIMPGANLTYLMGLTLHSRERLTLAILPTGTEPICLVLPEMELAATRTAVSAADPNETERVKFFAWSDADGPQSALQAALHDAIPRLQAQGADGAPLPTIGVEYTAMRVMELRALEQAATDISHHSPAVQTTDATALIAGLRMVKDEQELAAISQAVRIIEAALQCIIAQIRPGVTERQIATAWSHEIVAAGGEGESFTAIVAGGPHSANPHHYSSDRPFQGGDLIILDGGALYGGYASDITRTVALGEPGEHARHIYELVLRANRAGRNAVRPGTTGEQIDQTTRQVIAEAGYGEYFLHRTGHGLGLECHEPPYIVAGERLPLGVGTTFTIEPGIYVGGVGGVRIEDDVVITEDGCMSLTSFERELIILPSR